MKKWFAVVLYSTALLLSLAMNSSAEISSNELLQILKEKGVITNQDIEKAKESRKAKEKITQERDEVVVKAARRPKSVNFKGRVQVRYTSIENGNSANVVTYQKDFDETEFDGFSIRRARLRWFGEVIDRWKYHVQVSADGDHTDVGLKLQDAYLTYNAHPNFNITAGQFKARFSPSYLVAGPVLPLCERPLVIDQLAIKREIGISLESPKKGQLDGRGPGTKIYDKPVYYAVGLYNGNGFNETNNDNDNIVPTAMVVVRPLPYINFGLSYAYNHKGADNTRRNIWDFNSALDIGPVHVQFEYIQQHGHGFDRAYGYGIQGQFDLMDDFQLTARYDEFDPNVDVDNGFDSRWYTVGYNWFLRGQDIKWQLNYTFREEMHGINIDNNALVTHFQVLF